MYRSAPFLILLLLLPACVDYTRDASPVGAREPAKPVFDAATVIQDQWQHVRLKGATDYTVAIFQDRLAIRAVGTNSASGLVREVEIDPTNCRIFEWSWSVTRLQPGADIRERALEDVGAAVFLMFGDPGLLVDPDPVPTLRYVWTNDRVAKGSVVDNPYMPGTVRSLVVESGGARLGNWVTVKRDIVADFQKAFGRPPPDPIQAVALFTDNDQTRQPVEAYYGRGRVSCEP